MPTVRNSKKRDAIYTELCSRNDHPTVDELYRTIKDANPSLSMATVYRNLRQLCEEGKVNCIHGDTADRYDAHTEHHYHLLCTKCHRLFDLDIPEIPEIGKAIKGQFDGEVTSYSLLYTGLCKECAKSQKK